MYLAKMHTRYPEFHGAGYYNFMMACTEDELEAKIEDVSHDFSLEGTAYTDIDNVDDLLKKYPCKEDLNKAFFTK